MFVDSEIPGFPPRVGERWIPTLAQLLDQRLEDSIFFNPVFRPIRKYHPPLPNPPRKALEEVRPASGARLLLPDTLDASPTACQRLNILQRPDEELTQPAMVRDWDIRQHRLLYDRPHRRHPA